MPTAPLTSMFRRGLSVSAVCGVCKERAELDAPLAL